MTWNKIFYRFLGLLALIYALHITFNMIKGGVKVSPIITQYQVTQGFTMATLYAVFLFFISRKKQ